MYCLQGGASGTDIYMIIFQVMHLWTWGAAVSAAAINGAGAATYSGMIFAMYVVAALLDFSGVLTRTLLINVGSLPFGGSLTWNTFEIVNVLLTGALILVDVAGLLALSMMLGSMNQHKRKVMLAIDEMGRRSKRPVINLYDQMRRVPELLRFSREQHRQLIIAQFYLFIVFFLFYDLGLAINNTFRQLYWFQVLSAFMWTFGYALAEGVHSTVYLWFYFGLIAADCTGSIIGQIWRTVILSECVTNSGFSVDCGWLFWAGWLTILLVMIEIVLDVYLGFLVYVVVQQTKVDQNRIKHWKQEALPERIRVSHFKAEPGLEEFFIAEPESSRGSIPVRRQPSARQPMPRELVQAMMPPAAQAPYRLPAPPAPSVMQKYEYADAQLRPSLSEFSLSSATSDTRQQQRRRILVQNSQAQGLLTPEPIDKKLV